MENKALKIFWLALIPAAVFAQAPAPAPAVPVTVPPPQAAPSPQPAPPPAPEIRVENVVIGKDDFTRMQRELLLLEKRVKEAELRHQLTTKMKDIEKLSLPPPAPSEEKLIFKSMRQSIDGERTATFQMLDGALIIAREGDTLPNGMRVASIRNDSVTLRKGSVVKRLGVGGMATPNQPALPSGGALPFGIPR